MSNVPPGREGCGLAVSASLRISQLPDDSILDEEAPAGLRDPNAAIARHESMLRDRIEKGLSLGAIGLACREPRGQLGNFVPIVLEAGLCAFVGIDESGIIGAVVRQHCKWRLFVQPLGIGALGNKRLTDEPLMAAGQKCEEFRVCRSVQGRAVPMMPGGDGLSPDRPSLASGNSVHRPAEHIIEMNQG
jgi:hypothetical protein